MTLFFKKVMLALVGITFLGLVLRLHNISPLKLYPDSYQNLLVALNLKTGGQVVGSLGPDGMFYPDYLAWTRPGLPLLVNLFNLAIPHVDAAAQAAVLVTGVLAIPLVYWLLRTIFESSVVGITGSLLLSLSFNHIVWGGFILTETTALLIQFLLLLTLFIGLNKPVSLSHPLDLAAGVILGLGFLTRFEYIILILPLLFLIITKSQKPIIKLINLFIPFAFTVSIFLAFLFPVFPWWRLFIQTQDSFKTILIVLFLFLGLLSILYSLRRRFQSLISSPALFLVFFWFLLISIPFAPFLSGLREFIRYDFLLFLFFIIGIHILYFSTKYRYVAQFCLLSIFLLSPVYIQMNHDMQRYWTHLVPYFLIPSAYGLYQTYVFLAAKNYLYKIAFLLIVISQLLVSSKGIQSWGRGAWFSPNYEEIIASWLLPKLPKSNFILLTSLPEPYFFVTRASTYSISDSYPYLYLSQTLQNPSVYIIQDMGMFDQFPRFNQFINSSLSIYKIDQFETHTLYHFGPKYQFEYVPVKIYKIPLDKLRQEIDAYQIKTVK